MNRFKLQALHQRPQPKSCEALVPIHIPYACKAEKEFRRLRPSTARQLREMPQSVTTGAASGVACLVHAEICANTVRWLALNVYFPSSTQ